MIESAEDIELDSLLDELGLSKDPKDPEGSENLEAPQEAPKDKPQQVEPTKLTLVESESDTMQLKQEESDTDEGESDEDAAIQQKWEEATNELLNNYRNDRSEVASMIKVLRNKIVADNPVKPTRIYYESLCSLLSTQTQSNVNLIKLIDALSKKMGKGDNSLGDILGDIL